MSDEADRRDMVNRLWQHGLHEERLFHDRLNYFSILQTGLLTIFGVMYNKEASLGFFLPLTVVAMLFTLLWLLIQTRHWAYCEHVNARIMELVPEYRETVEGFDGGGKRGGLSISKPMALAVPVLFAVTWVAFFAWLLVRPTVVGVPSVSATPERVALAVLTLALVVVVVRLRRIERCLREAR